jgi:ClpX C4-type zinc finger
MSQTVKTTKGLVDRRNEKMIADTAKSLGVNPSALVLYLGCDFCGLDQRHVDVLIAGTALLPDIEVHICDACVAVCSEIIESRKDHPHE